MNQRNIVNRLLVIVLLAVVTSFFPVYAQQMNPLLYSTETNGQQSVDTIDAAEPFVAAAPMKLVCESRIEHRKVILGDVNGTVRFRLDLRRMS